MSGHSHGTVRLDNFTDAAFAFAVSLLVIGAGEAPATYEQLRSNLSNLPIFALGFFVLAFFWRGHVRWRQLCGSEDRVSVRLTLALVFLVLIYVFPLRVLAALTVAWIAGDEKRLTEVAADGGADLWVAYGLGCAAMAGTLAALFLRGLATSDDPETRRKVRAEAAGWGATAVGGVVSAAVARLPSGYAFAGPVYCLTPLFARVIGRLLLLRDSGSGARPVSAEQH